MSLGPEKWGGILSLERGVIFVIEASPDTGDRDAHILLGEEDSSLLGELSINGTQEAS